ncbi:MAG: sigma-70 family RNA polymerase sigma factor [Coriobacteriia bacterium]|nr:sigma-70 family RNA polymerase sigma factor [Coriobacteriia bacterium]
MNNLQLSTAAKIKLAGQGDQQALSELFDEYQLPIYLQAFALLHSHALAEDAVQDCFVKLMDAAARYQPTGSARAWLMRIAHNAAVDILRREGRGTALFDEITHVDKGYAELEGELEFLRVTAQLRDLDRTIIICRVFADMPHSEVAQVVGLSAGAVRVRYRRIIAQLKEFYEKEGRR